MTKRSSFSRSLFRQALDVTRETVLCQVVRCQQVLDDASETVPCGLSTTDELK